MQDNNEQEIIQEYFKQQKETNLTLCIYEEKASNDIEWYYDGYDWCYLKIKKYKEKIDDETYYGEKFIVEKKRIKTFGKKCHIVTMSYDNFMAIDYMKYKNVEEVDVETAHEYANNFMKLKKEKQQENIDFFIEDYHEYLKQQEIKNREEIQAGCRDFVLWCITIILAITVVGIPLALFTCPLFWKLLNKIKNNKVNKNDETTEDDE